jgi:hypothetical protein
MTDLDGLSDVLFSLKVRLNHVLYLLIFLSKSLSPPFSQRGRTGTVFPAQTGDGFSGRVQTGIFA